MFKIIIATCIKTMGSHTFFQRSHFNNNQSIANKKNSKANKVCSEKSGWSEDGKALSQSDNFQSVKRKKKWMKNRKKRAKGHPNGETGEGSGGISGNPSPSTRKREETDDSVQPPKKRKRRKKKKTVKAEETSAENSTGYMPILHVKKPEDYSANWKKLKEVIVHCIRFYLYSIL